MRRFHALLVCLIVGGCSGVALDPPTQSEASALTEPGDFTGPAWSEDGTRVSFSGPGYRGLYDVAVDGGEVREIVAPDKRTWFRHGWQDDRVVRPVLGQQPGLEVTPHDGVVRVLNANPLAGPRLELRRDDVVWVDGAEERWLTHGEDRFCDPVASLDWSQVAVVGLQTGVHVLDTDTGEALAHAGPGTSPAWHPDGGLLVFERTEDDGYQLTAGDLWALDLDAEQIRPLTATAAIEQHPAVSPDGTRVAFIRDGAVWVSALGEEVSP